MPDHPTDVKDEKDKRKRFSLNRRTFLKSAGLASAGAASVGLLEDLAAQTQEANPVQGPGAVPINLRVNGESRRLNLEPRTTLAEALRDELHLTGTKIVCDRGACSACTVMLDKTLVCSCMTLAIDAQGRDVRTVESIASTEHLHPVQAAFIQHDGMQCGFCTPGMMITARALLDRIPDPDEETIREAISGQICRCTGYTTIVRSIQWAARNGSGRAVESGPSETEFAPETQTETTHGGDAAEPLIEAGSNA